MITILMFTLSVLNFMLYIKSPSTRKLNLIAGIVGISAATMSYPN